MNSHRLEQLLLFYEENPNDPFNIYAIATEYLDTQPNKALNYYERLLIEHPTYLPTYYHVAKLYSDIGKYHLAKSTYEKGITLAKQQHEQLALRELQNAYDELMFD